MRSDLFVGKTTKAFIVNRQPTEVRTTTLFSRALQLLIQSRKVYGQQNVRRFTINQAHRVGMFKEFEISYRKGICIRILHTSVHNLPSALSGQSETKSGLPVNGNSNSYDS